MNLRSPKNGSLNQQSNKPDLLKPSTENIIEFHEQKRKVDSEKKVTTSSNGDILLSDSQENEIQSDSTDKLSKQQTKSVCNRIPNRNFCNSYDAPKKTVHVQHFDGKKFKVPNRTNIKKDKLPDTATELARCREEKVNYLDFSNLGIQVLSAGIFKDVLFIEKLYLYGNKLTCLSPGIGSLVNLQQLMLQQNWIVNSGLPNEISKLSKLKILDLRHNRLENQIPACIYKLSNLEQLILSFNKIYILDDELKNLQRLTVLMINRNSLHFSIPSSIGQLTRLTKLDIAYNQIESLPNSIGECTCLQELNLQHNQITHLPETIGNLINLTHLTLKYNRLVEIPETLSKCTKLVEFNVENNQLSFLPETLLCNLKCARNITISRNVFVVFPSGGPEQFSNTWTLNMDHNKIRAIPPNILSKSENLTRFNLRDNEITELIGDDLRTWRRIVELDIGSNHLSFLPNEIENLEELQVLRLNYNQLQELPTQIGNLINLRLLDLESNQLECLPSSISKLINLQELNVSCNQLVTFPTTMGSLPKLKLIKAGENDIREVPSSFGNMVALQDLYLNDNVNLNNLPAELSSCSTLTILSIGNCPLHDLPQLIVAGGSAMIIYFLQQVLQLRRQQTPL